MSVSLTKLENDRLFVRFHDSLAFIEFAETNPSLLQCNIRPLQIRWPLLDGSRARKVIIKNDYLVFQHFSILPSNSSLCSGRNLVLGQQDPSLLSSLFKEMSNSKTLLLIIALFRGRGISGIIKNAAFLQSCQRSYTLEGGSWNITVKKCICRKYVIVVIT